MKRNSVILNGVRSETISGLLIQELPPIIKPPMRNEVEEIDGRDGSIVTRLGYAAYDREMIIGLYDNYDIDRIIQYFNSSGEAIFSNEPDKVYQYQILDEIDFERLARFRVASVTFYVQPFKRSATPEFYQYLGGLAESLDVFNLGNVGSRPEITVMGQGVVTFALNGNNVLAVDFGSTTTVVTIDVEKMNAYSGGSYYNRKVAGDYNDLILPVGKNTISWSGTYLGSMTVEKCSCWI